MKMEQKQRNQKAQSHDSNTSMADERVLSAGEKAEVLKNFMEEFFPFNELQKAGFFTKEMKGDYQAQADRVCKWFGYKTVYEYGAKEIQAHLSYAGERPKDEPFVMVIPSIYE